MKKDELKSILKDWTKVNGKSIRSKIDTGFEKFLETISNPQKMRKKSRQFALFGLGVYAGWMLKELDQFERGPVVIDVVVDQSIDNIKTSAVAPDIMLTGETTYGPYFNQDSTVASYLFFGDGTVFVEPK
jgi:hypothetical protein